jgi:hypothetical protein
MQIKGTNHLTHPAFIVFQTLRDKTPDLVSIMPNIDAVEVLSRKETPPIVQLHNKWYGSQQNVPKLIRPFINKNLTCWFDHANWDEEHLCCRWSIECIISSKIFACEGTTMITAESNACSTFTLQGEMNINIDSIPGIPPLLVRKLKSPLETFIVNAIGPNLTSIATAVQKYLDDQH